MKFKSKNLSFEWTYDLSKQIKKNFDHTALKNGIKKVIDEDIKGAIDRGLSPVDGVRAFQKYKNPKVYPADQKQSNKPNLNLTGSMLSKYDVKNKDHLSVTIGIHKDNDKKTLDKALANNEGTQGIRGKKLLTAKASAQRGELGTIRRKAASKLIQSTKGIPARPFVPLKGQQYTKTITAKIKKAFAEVIKKAIGKK